MSDASAQRTRFLVILLAAVALFAVYRVADPFGGADPVTVDAAGNSNPERRAFPSRGRGGRGRAAVDPTTLPVEELQVAALDPERGSYEIGRNLWQFYTPPPPPVQPPPPPPEPMVVHAPPPPPEPVVEPPRGPVLPSIHFRYLGSFGPKSRRIAVLEEGDEIMNVLEGDVVREEFVVAKIGFESIYIEYKNHPEEPAKQLEIGG